MQAMDWRRIRQTLRELRAERKMGVPELAEEAGVAKTTVYRLEDLSEEPDRGPDLETIEKLAIAMDLTLTEFFARIDGLQPQPLGDRSAAPPAASRGADTPIPKPLDTNAIAASTARAVTRLADNIDRLVSELREAREQTTSDRAHPAGRHARHRKTG